MKSKVSSWQKEFPKIFLLIKQPKKFFADSLLKTEKFIRKLVVWLTVVLIACLVFKSFQNNDVMINGGKLPFEQCYILMVWKNYRNMLYLILFVDLILTLAIVIVRIKKKQAAMAIKQFLSWISVFLFLTFSYAIMAFIVNLIFMAIYIHTALIGEDTKILRIKYENQMGY